MKMGMIVILTLSAIFVETTRSQRLSDQSVLDRRLSQGYDWRHHPESREGSAHGPTLVTVNVYIRRAKLADQELDWEITFRQSWTDPRLAYVNDYERNETIPNFIILHPLDKAQHRIWTPDTFFSSAYDVKFHDLPAPNELVRVYPRGDVLLSQRFSLKTVCPATFDTYPKDRHECNLDIASYAYTGDDIVYEWKKDSPVQMKAAFYATSIGFLLEDVKTSECTSKTATGQYSCVRASLTFKRIHSSLSSSKLYVVPLVLTLLSLLPMIINAQAIMLRVIIGFFCLGTLILHWSIIDEELPKVGYVTAADMWLTRCLGFIAATLVQLVFYVWIVRATNSHKERKLAKQRVAKELLTLERKEGVEDNVTLMYSDGPQVPERKLSISLLVDLISLGLFILAFLAFLIHYFTKY